MAVPTTPMIAVREIRCIAKAVSDQVGRIEGSVIGRVCWVRHTLEMLREVAS